MDVDEALPPPVCYVPKIGLLNLFQHSSTYSLFVIAFFNYETYEFRFYKLKSALLLITPRTYELI